MNQWPTQTDASHDLELADRELERVQRQHSEEWSTADDLARAWLDADEAWVDVVVEEAAKAALGTHGPQGVDVAVRKMMCLMGVGVMR
jgi:hypothetical protein